MDPRALGIFIPIIALLIPVVAIIMGGIHKMQRLKIEEIKARSASLGSGGEEELQALKEEVDGLRSEMAEVQERLDFTERLIARQSDQDRLPKP
ncbi:MAG: hypothetical protein ABJC74_08445 [Gemmatimonadota bacterium]